MNQNGFIRSITGNPQTISINSPTLLAIGKNTTVSGNSTSGLAVSFSTTNKNKICAVSNVGLVTGLSKGICTITATQAGNVQYDAAKNVTANITINNGEHEKIIPIINSLLLDDE